MKEKNMITLRGSARARKEFRSGHVYLKNFNMRDSSLARTGRLGSRGKCGEIFNGATDVVFGLFLAGL
jgi:hypothetical protein